MGSNKIRKADLDGIWWREGGGVFFLLIKFSRSSEVIQGHRGSNMGSNRSVRPILMGFGGGKGGGVFFLLIKFSRSPEVIGVKYGVK